MSSPASYSVQSREPSFHSCRSPSIRMIKNRRAPEITLCRGRQLRVRGSGISRAISISNTRKITAKRKKRSENGIRADLLGSNPHSNAELFSRSIKEREDSIAVASRITTGNRTAIIIARRECLIY